MARPKTSGPGLPAKKRIEEAFWQLLEEMPYHHISIKRLADKANVNHKTIYYYYDNIDHMAKDLFEENLASHFSQDNFFLAVLNDYPEEFLRNQYFEVGARRTILYSRSDSPFLNGIFKEYIRKSWLLSMGLTEEDLSEDEKTELEFILSGIIALPGKDFSLDNIRRILRMFDRDLGKAIKNTLLQLSKKHQSQP